MNDCGKKKAIIKDKNLGFLTAKRHRYGIKCFATSKRPLKKEAFYKKALFDSIIEICFLSSVRWFCRSLIVTLNS